ncbi:MAG: cell wall-active antibiotics response protein [Candidatus Cloacimonetes bacterium]|nr:cell wall-active antibiotics response protein [Candidatus Cloacimonadota bacterium]
MNILSSGVFWGMLLILVGLSIIIKIIFQIDIPVFRIIIGVLLIYFGMQIIFGSNFLYRRRVSQRRQEGTFREYNLQRGGNEFNVIFGRSKIDLTDRRELKSDEFVVVNVIFGSALVYIDPAIPMQIEVNTVFGDASLPDKKFAVIGQEKFRTGDENYNGKILYLEISSIFGSVQMVEKQEVNEA